MNDDGIRAVNRLQRLLWLLEQHPPVRAVPMPPIERRERPTFAEMLAVVNRPRRRRTGNHSENLRAEPLRGVAEFVGLDAERLRQSATHPQTRLGDASFPGTDGARGDAEGTGQLVLRDQPALPVLADSIHRTPSYHSPPGSGKVVVDKRFTSDYDRPMTTNTPTHDPILGHSMKAVSVHGAKMQQCRVCGARLGSAASGRPCADVVAKWGKRA